MMKTWVLIVLMALTACANKDRFAEQDALNPESTSLQRAVEQQQAEGAPEQSPAPTEPQGNVNGNISGNTTGNTTGTTSGKPARQEQEPARKQEISKKIIKTAQVSIRVDEYKEMGKKVNEIVKKYEGYTSSLSEVNTDHGLQTETVIRMPNGNFDACLEELVALASFVENRTVNAQDVTEEFVDLQARLKTKREVEARYVEILKSAKTIEEILRVENELRVIREEIEAKQGRVHYLMNQVSFSTITLRYTRTNQEYVKPPEETFTGRFFSGFSNGWQGLLGFFIVLANLWPIVLIGGAGAWWARKKWKGKIS